MNIRLFILPVSLLAACVAVLVMNRGELRSGDNSPRPAAWRGNVPQLEEGGMMSPRAPRAARSAEAAVAMPNALADPEARGASVVDQLPADERASFQRALQQARYGVEAVTAEDREGRSDLQVVSHHASNPGQDLMFQFSENGGVRLLSGKVGKTWEGVLRLKEMVGMASALDGSWRPDGTRMERGSGDLTEWYVNRPDGMEHGFTVAREPAGRKKGEPLTLRLALDGLRAEIDTEVGPGGEATGDLVFSDPETREPVLGYRGLKVWDAEGNRLAAEMRPTGDGFLIAVNDSGARYPVTIDPLIVSLEKAIQAPAQGPITYVKASNTESRDCFGGWSGSDGKTAISLSGDTLVVGAGDESGGSSGVNGDQSSNTKSRAGAVYVFVRNRGIWTQQAYLKASNADAGDFFGVSVAISGDTLVVGAPGESSAATGVNGLQSNNSSNWSGAAYVFVRQGVTWSQQAYLKASNTGAGDFFGRDVAISGEIIAVAAPSEASAATGINGNQNSDAAPGAGAVYVFSRTGSSWSQSSYIKASNAETRDVFGSSISLSGGTLAVGATGESSAATGVNGSQGNGASGAGAVYIFTRGASWTQQAYLKASNTGWGDRFGSSVATSGNTVVVGAIYEDSDATGVNGNQYDSEIAQTGAAYVFLRTDGNWAQQAYLKASNTGSGDEFGTAVAIFGDSLVVGASLESSSSDGINGVQNNNAAYRAGAAYQFVRTGTTWRQSAYLKAPNSEEDHFFGVGLGVGDGVIVVAADGENSAATGIDGDQSNNAARFAGAAYIFGTAGGADNDHFGLSVDVDGDNAVVGALDHDHLGASATGKAWMFHRTGTDWSVEAGVINTSPAQGDRFGVAVAVSGNRVVVGADHDDEPNVLGVPRVDCGSASLFERDAGGLWMRSVKLSPEAAGANFGRAVAMDGTRLLIGATRGNGNRGQVWDYVGTGPAPFQLGVLSSAFPQVDAQFGFSIAISGSRLAIGSPGQDTTSISTYVDSGMVSYFKPGVFGYWDPDGETRLLRTNARSGFSVAIDGDVVVVGCSGPAGWAGGVNDPGRVGEAFVVTNNGSGWSAPKLLDASGFGAGAWFGMSVAIEDGVIAVGAFGNEVFTGKVRIFQQQGTTWVKQQDLDAGNGESDNAYGISVALSGDTLLVGGYRADSDWVNAGMAWVYRIGGQSSAGAVLTISRSGANAVLTWPAGTGLALWKSPTMATGSWTKVAGSESVTTHSVPVSAAPKMFFRLAAP